MHGMQKMQSEKNLSKRSVIYRLVIIQNSRIFRTYRFEKYPK